MIVNAERAQSALKARLPGGLACTALLLCGAFLILLLLLRSYPGNEAAITMRIVVQHADRAQWFFDTGSGFSELESRVADLKPGENDVSFSLPKGIYSNLRLDPVTSNQPVTIESMEIKPAAAVRAGRFDLDEITSRKDIRQITKDAGGLLIVPEEGGRDPQLNLRLESPLEISDERRPLPSLFIVALILTFLCWLAATVLRRMRAQWLVVTGLSAALVLILTMNAISADLVRLHPDESLHLACMAYFLQNFWPPAAADPGIVASLQASPWGISYLNSYDIVYFLAGSLVAPVVDFIDSPSTAARLFQTVLWLGLLAMASYNRAWALAICVVLMSPQVWYVFSYFNGDALPFLLSMVAVALVVDRNGAVEAFMGSTAKLGAGAVILAACLGGLLVSKANFYPVIFGIFLWLSIRHLKLGWIELIGLLIAAGATGAVSMLGDWTQEDAGRSRLILLVFGAASAVVAFVALAHRYVFHRESRPVFHRLLALALLAAMFALPRIVNDAWINGSPAEKAMVILETQELYADPRFKPSAIEAGEGHPGLRFAQRGIPLGEMLFGRWEWLSNSLKSSFGTYGHMNIWAPDWFYRLQIIGFGFVLLVASGRLALRGAGLGLKQVVCVFGVASLVLISSILYSWLYSMQAQGRYLMPMLPLFGLLLGTAFQDDSRMLRPLLFFLLVLSVLSFAWVGLPGIASKT